MKTKLPKRICALALTFALAASAVVPAFAANAAGSTASDTDLTCQDTIDYSRTASLTIHKYDITAAEAAGDAAAALSEATGSTDSALETSLRDYAIEGVEFTYLRVGAVETYSAPSGTGSSLELVYEIPDELAAILKLDTSEALDLTDTAYPCSRNGVAHYTSSAISEAMEAVLSADDVAVKNALEAYAAGSSSAVKMEKTDADGLTSASGLPLGLYLIVETAVPENITTTVDPWFASLPFTDAAGDQWLYDMTCYPKNQSGNPTLDKSVRSAYSAILTDDHNGSTDSSLLIWNTDLAADTDDDAYIANRGGYTTDGVTSSGALSYDYTYRDTNTASEGDLLDYILVSHLPHITSTATYLSDYTFHDSLSAGLSYSRDTRIALYTNAEDAGANNTANAAAIWSAGTEFTAEYTENADGTSTMTVSLCADGLRSVNEQYSDCYLVVYYTAVLQSSADAVLGDDGNPNHVSLIWSRTASGYSDMLEDENYIYTYGIDLTKKFSDDNGDYSNVRFRLYNTTDCCYVTAEAETDSSGALTGTYYVTGKAKSAEEATTFVPASDGTVYIAGIEADTYRLTETATDTGYSLLQDGIVIAITATDRDIIASTAGVTGMDEDAVSAIVSSYNGGIYNENGQLVTRSEDELNGSAASAPNTAAANGNEIGETDLYVGAVKAASATMDTVTTQMQADADSNHAKVALTVTNQKNFLLPQTGGSGLFVLTIAGCCIAAFGIFLLCSKRRKDS